MFEPKPISRDGIPAALAKAERYRLLNEPGEAARADGLLDRLSDRYEHEYYKGIIRERRAKAALQRDSFHSSASAVGWLHDAMECFDRAEALKPAHNDDAVLRWNACARLLQRLPQAGHLDRYCSLHECLP